MSGRRSSIALLEPFFSGSHRQWAKTMERYSKHEIRIFSLPGRFWKWRMHGGAVDLAYAFLESGYQADFILATDMLDLTTFLSLTRKKTTGTPVYLYFHENQLTYPWSMNDPDVHSGRDNHYGFINYTSALSADRILFNSRYHLDSFLGALPGFLNQFPDRRGLQHVETLHSKSEVFPLLLDLKKFDPFRMEEKGGARDERPCTFLWNHRWEYDKDPDAFFHLMYQLAEAGHDFRLIVLGEHFGNEPACFREARVRLEDYIDHWGYAQDLGAYARLLWQADIIPVVSRQDFFGASIIEAVYCETMPLLPKRLAYPEHIPESLADTCLYSEEDELLDKCIQVIGNIAHYRSISFQNIAARYEVRRRIAGFDALFDAELLKKSQNA